MGSQADKTRQPWLPFIVFVAIVLAVFWFLGGNQILLNLLGNDQGLGFQSSSTSTEVPAQSPSPIKTSTGEAVISTLTQTLTASTSTSVLANDLAAAFTPGPTPTTNCTYTIHFWKAYSGAWEIDRFVFDDRSYTKVQAIVILNIDDPNLASTRLIQQYMAASLNTVNGADPTEIERTMERILEWLIHHPPEIGLTQDESLEGDMLADKLQDFNNGATGPGHCINEPFTPTPGATPTPLNYTPPAIATFTSGPIYTLVPPTLTPTKHSGRPKPTNPPTNPPPPPSNTQIPPTPIPTPTLRPPTTPTP